MSKTQSGPLLIADITGYTLFLSESELEHAQEILTSLLNLLIAQTRPPLIISRTAGDAVISYAIGLPAIQSQTFVELLEDTYVAFRRAIELMVLNNTCRCAACANVSALDLKFFVHFGVFGVQNLGGHDELVGSDVNLLHRLLKNHIIEATGIRAYTVYTAAAIAALGLAEIAASMIPHTEQYEHLGEVHMLVQDMQPAWKARRDEIVVDIPEEHVQVRVSRDFSLPPHLLWDVLSRPDFRKLILQAVNQTVINRQEGRIAPGSEFHCDHGNRVTLQRILTWHPFEMIVTEDTTPIPGTTIYIRWQLIPNHGGTTLEIAAGDGRGGFIRRHLVNVVAKKMLPREFGNGLERLHQHLAATNVSASPAA